MDRARESCECERWAGWLALVFGDRVCSGGRFCVCSTRFGRFGGDATEDVRVRFGAVGCEMRTYGVDVANAVFWLQF